MTLLYKFLRFGGMFAGVALMATTLQAVENAAVEIESGTMKVNATEASIVYDAADTELETLRTYNGKVIFKGSGSNGVTLPYAIGKGRMTAKFAFDGGTHTFQYGVDQTECLFGPTGTNDNPTLEVKNKAVLNFRTKDLSGWNVQLNADEVILRVRDESTLNFVQYNGTTTYFNNRLVLDNGAKVNVADMGDKFRMNGGVRTEETAQLTMLGGDTATSASVTGGKITLASDSTKGVGVSVGRNATLSIANEIAGASDRPFAKWGAGTLVLGGAFSDSPITVNAGTLDFAVEEGTRTLSVGISGSGTVKKSGAGTLTLQGSVSDTVGLEVAAGRLVMPLPATSRTVTANGGTLVLRLTKEAIAQQTITTSLRWTGETSQVQVVDSNDQTLTAEITKDSENVLTVTLQPQTLNWESSAESWETGLADFKPWDNVTFAANDAANSIEIPGGTKISQMTIYGNYAFAVVPGGLTATKITVAESAKAIFTSPKVRYVRLQLDHATGGESGNNAVPGVSELILTKGGEAVAWPRGTSIWQVNPDGSKVDPEWNAGGNEDVNALIDGVWKRDGATLQWTNPRDGSQDYYTDVNVTDNKWWPKQSPKAYAVISLGAAIDFDGYKLMTTDYRPRSAKDWTLEVSEDGVTWAVADSRTNWAVPESNSFYIYEGSNTVFPVSPVMAVSAPIEVESDGTLGGTATIAGNVTFAMGSILDATAEQPLEITGTVTATGTEDFPTGMVSVSLPSDVALWPVLKTPTETLAESFSAYGYKFLYREGTYWAVRTAAKALSAEVTTAEALSNLVWLGTDSQAVAREEVLKLWAFGLDDATATLNTTAAATVTIDCPAVPALKLEGSAAVTLAKDNDVTPAIASLTVSADSTVAAKLLQCVTGSATVAEGKTLSLTGKNDSLSKLPTGTGAVKIPAGSSVTYTNGTDAYSGRTTVEGSLTLACTLGFTQDGKENPTYPINIEQGGTVTLAQKASTFRSFRGKGDLVVTGTDAVLGIPGDASVEGGFAVTGNVAVNANAVLTVTSWTSNAVLSGANLQIAGEVKKGNYNFSLDVANGKSLSGTGTIRVPLTFAAGAVIEAGSDAVTCTGTVTLPATGAVTVKATAYGAPVLKKSGLDIAKFALPTEAGWKTEGLFTEQGGTLYLVAKPAFTQPEGGSAMSDATARAIAELAAAKGNYGITTVAVQAGRVPEAVELFTDVMTVDGATATIAYDFGVSDLTISTLQTTVDGGKLTKGTQYVLVCATVSNKSDLAQNTASYATGTALTLLNNGSPLTGVVEPTTAEIAALRLTKPTGSRWLAVPMGTLFPEEHKTGTMKLTVKASK